jgi:hypothetical protein
MKFCTLPHTHCILFDTSPSLAGRIDLQTVLAHDGFVLGLDAVYRSTSFAKGGLCDMEGALSTMSARAEQFP